MRLIICSGMTVKRNVRNVRIIALTVKMETVTLIGKGRYKLTCFVY